MATTKSAPAKKTAAKKATVKKAPVKKATARKATAKKATGKKAPARKTAARKTAVKPVARKAPAATAAGAATSAADVVREAINSAARESSDTFQQYKSVAGDQTSELLDFVRGVVDITVGVPFVLQARIADTAATSNLDVDTVKALLTDAKSRLSSAPSVDFDAVKSFIDAAKSEGHTRIVVAQHYIAPLAGNASERLGDAAELFEQLPGQLSELLESGRARIKSLIAA